MRQRLGLGKIVALYIVVLVLGVIIGFYFSSVRSEAETITRSFTFATTIIEAVPQTTTKTISLTITEVLPKTITTTTSTTVTESFTKTVTVSEKGEGVRVLGVCFSRTMDCSSLIRYWISRANESVHVMVYGFTLDDLSEALIEAKGRGVEVRVVIERESAYWSGSEYERLLSAGVDIRLDGNPHTMHHKVVVIDGKIVVTGSYNWTWSAENRNDENVVVLMDEGLAESYEKEFQRVWLEAS
ncbi:MAG: phospholipase D family protein [Thaumarchaeota archaeon]|nr:phospholipase D family protein [Nitrososphaerota archaeon]